MNKIKGKVNSDDFSPWEESFQDLLKTMELAKRKHLMNDLTKTIDPPQKILRKHASKSMMSKTLLNMSKINLHSIQDHYCPPIQQEPKQLESRRYSGPRVTFYAKMNPRATGRSKSSLKVDENEENYFIKRSIKESLIRDQSIKYLQIIEEKKFLEEDHKKPNTYIIPKPLNLHRVKAVRSQRNDEQHMYLRRLKMIYNTRKESKQ